MKFPKSSIANLFFFGILAFFYLNLPAQRSLSLPLPAPPKTPPPDNKTKPGGGLAPERNACHSQQESLTALIPKQNPVLTASNQPTFLFYIPDETKDIIKGEFWINSRDEKIRIYPKIHLKFPTTPGIVSVSLPKLPESLLEEDKYYHWYFKIYCQDNTPNEADLEVDGWIQRVPLTPERESQIKAGKPAIWYDALAELYQRLRLSPNDIQLKENWSNLLKFIDAQDLEQKPIIDSVILIEE